MPHEHQRVGMNKLSDALNSALLSSSAEPAHTACEYKCHPTSHRICVFIHANVYAFWFSHIWDVIEFKGKDRPVCRIANQDIALHYSCISSLVTKILPNITPVCRHC